MGASDIAPARRRHRRARAHRHERYRYRGRWPGVPHRGSGQNLDALTRGRRKRPHRRNEATKVNGEGRRDVRVVRGSKLRSPPFLRCSCATVPSVSSATSLCKKPGRPRSKDRRSTYMAVRLWFTIPALALTGALAAQTINSGALALGAQPLAAADTPAPAQDASTLDDQTELALTVYNSDLALVRDVRTLRLPRGVSDLHFMDVAATVNPATVHFRSLTEPARLGVLEQNYEYDLLEPEKLLRKYVGRDVTLVRMGSKGEETITARLLSYNNAPVWQIGSEIVTGMHADHIRFPELPGNLFARPTLIWSLNNEGGTSHRVEASYLATKLSWNADYVLTVARDDKAADIDGWVTVTNGSGTSFRNASLQLVAGELNRVRQMFDRMEADVQLRAAAPAVAEAMTQEAFSDYHLYTLPRKTSVNNNQTKQVSMLDASEFPVVKRYVVNGQA